MWHWWKIVGIPVLLTALAGCEGISDFTQANLGGEPVIDTAQSPTIGQNERAALARGEQALDDGDLELARQAYRSVLRVHPAHPSAALGLAQTYIETRQFDTARRFVEIADGIRSDHDRAALGFVIGQLARHDGDLLEAVRRFHESVSYKPGFWRAWLALGRVQTKRGMFAEAREAFGAAAKFAPTQAAIRNDMGMSFIAEKKPTSAIGHFEAALAESPSNATARANLRIAQAMLGRYDAAVSGAAERDLADTLNNVGYIALLNGDLAVADRLLRRAVEVSPSFHEAANANLDLLAQARARQFASAPQGTPGGAAASNYRDLTPQGLAVGRALQGEGRVQAEPGLGSPAPVASVNVPPAGEVPQVAAEPMSMLVPVVRETSKSAPRQSGEAGGIAAPEPAVAPALPELKPAVPSTSEDDLPDPAKPDPLLVRAVVSSSRTAFANAPGSGAMPQEALRPLLLRGVAVRLEPVVPDPVMVEPASQTDSWQPDQGASLPDLPDVVRRPASPVGAGATTPVSAALLQRPRVVHPERPRAKPEPRTVVPAIQEESTGRVQSNRRRVRAPGRRLVLSAPQGIAE